MRLNRIYSLLRYLLCAVVAITAYISVCAQSIQALMLKRNYNYSTLDQIIDQIGEDLNIRFTFDRDHL